MRKEELPKKEKPLKKEIDKVCFLVIVIREIMFCVEKEEYASCLRQRRKLNG